MGNTPAKNITVFVACDEETHEIHTYPGEYRSLMMLIYDHIYMEGFGVCLGMGKCGTCLIEIVSSCHLLSFYERNEDTTLLRSGYAGKNVRLACQVIADEFIDGLKVNILT